MFVDCGLAFVVGDRAGRVSRRYMRMKPRMRERPIQACGVREEGDCGEDGRMEGVSGRVGGLMGLEVSLGGGGGSGAFGAGVSGSMRFELGMGWCSCCRLGCHRPSSECGERFLRLWAWECAESPALYKVSTPSGMITINAVPTKTPIPIVDINLSRDCESEKDRGREPARKELRCR